MPKLSVAVINRRIDVLKAQAEKLQKRERVPALHEIIRLMRDHGIAVAEVRAALNGTGPRKGGVKRLTKKGRPRRKVAPMYRHPRTGETWSGRGRPARWVSAAEKKGHPRTEFLIKKN
jgi:DNA-binding protein H-NS